jgi:hypothetical protein
VLFWYGYGTLVPWAYRPLYRQYHYYNVFSFPVAALLPFTLGHALAGRMRTAQGVLAGALVFHLLSMSVAGRWGAPVDVSRELMAYARQHPDRQFLTDVNSFNQMYVLGGFTLPDNIVCLNGPPVRNHLLLNKEPPGTPPFEFEERRVDAVLVNREQEQLHGFERQFAAYLEAHQGTVTTVVPRRFRLPFVPLVRLFGPREFFVKSAPGEAVAIVPIHATDRPGMADR